MKRWTFRPPPAALRATPHSVMKPPPTGRLKRARVGTPPRPRRRGVARGANRASLGDLFSLFPDLPRPPLPPLRVLPLTLARRLTRR